MTIICPTLGDPFLLDSLLGTTTISTYKYHLFTGSPTLNVSTTLATLVALEATFTGYSAISVTTWNASTVVSSQGVATASSSITYTYTTGAGSPQTLTGYYVTDSASANLLWFEAFATSQTLSPSDTLTINPSFSLVTQ